MQIEAFGDRVVERRRGIRFGLQQQRRLVHSRRAQFARATAADAVLEHAELVLDRKERIVECSRGGSGNGSGPLWRHVHLEMKCLGRRRRRGCAVLVRRCRCWTVLFVMIGIG